MGIISMQYRNDARTVTGDRASIAALATGAAFVVGYTLARVCLLPGPVAVDPTVQPMVVPHAATLWSDFAE